MPLFNSFDPASLTGHLLEFPGNDAHAMMCAQHIDAALSISLFLFESRLKA